MIITVDETNLLQAATIHSTSWKESHRAFCTTDFVEKHTPERQREYINNKMKNGTKFYMLVDERPVGIVSVTNSLIEDLYVLPDIQNTGCGTKLLQFAIGKCTGIPTLWILENNTGAKRLYHKMGFQETGKIREITDGLDEIELALARSEFEFITLRDRPELMGKAAAWFHEKWRVPAEAYLECMTAYLNLETEYGWYLCLAGERIVGGLGVIENDFHDRKDLTPNVCAVYTEEDCRCRGIAGRLLNMAVEDMRAKGITPLYLFTDHTGFYERYGWEFFCMAQGDGEPEMSRMYIHR